MLLKILNKDTKITFSNLNVPLRTQFLTANMPILWVYIPLFVLLTPSECNSVFEMEEVDIRLDLDLDFRLF